MFRFARKLIPLIVVAASVSTSGAEGETVSVGGVEMENASSSAAFEMVRKKIGKWEGQMTQGLTGLTFDVSYVWAITSGGNTITETITEDGVEMLTTYSDQDGELVIKHYCGLGTEPIFAVSELTAERMEIAVDEERSGLHRGHHSFVTGMRWTMDPDDADGMVFENTVVIDGEESSNRAVLKRVM